MHLTPSVPRYRSLLLTTLVLSACALHAQQAPPPAPAAPITIQPTTAPDANAPTTGPVAVPSLAGTPAAAKPSTPPAKVPPVVAVPSLAGVPADTTPNPDPQQPPAPGTVAPTPLPASAATFGFTAGETRDEILTAIGKDAIIKTDGDIIEVRKAPLPNSAFDSFLLIVGPKQGLVKIIATGTDIEGDSEGKALKASFAQMRDTLKATFGDPSENFDYLKADSTHKKSSEFMLSLTNNERTFATYWTKRSFVNNVTNVELEGNGLGNDKGYISVEIEFLPYRDYVLTRKP